MKAANAKLAETAGYMKVGWHKYWGSAAHHLVAGADRRADVARDILSRAGFKIDDAVNSVFLKHIKKYRLNLVPIIELFILMYTIRK